MQLSVSSPISRYKGPKHKLIIESEQDEAEAIDKSNILGGGRTRGAKQPSGTYQEPGDEDGLPGPEEGTSSTR
jgi:hypothetical protein